ncbi:galactose mutarotase-like domain-containing protein [Kalaharituber pfeilii]|nr:galactose mutarotase-like domain-containing protein [Kalaharituber pfeilii]
MVERSHKPAAISAPSAQAETGSVIADAEKVTLTLPTGESVEILLYGATIISWKAKGAENLWLSSAAKLDGTKAVRGGIPLVFPVFGTSTDATVAALPQHGFARVSKWEILGKTSDSATSVQVDLGLSPQNVPEHLREKWRFPFGLIYTVTLSQNNLETKMLVRNEGNDTIKFHILFHTYFQVPDATKVAVTGLNGVTYKDKVQGGATITEANTNVTITGETDRVYAQVPGEVIIESDGKPMYKVVRTDLDDVVVWNPWKEAASKIGDFRPEDGWKAMLCVEAGSVTEWQTLEGGSVWEGGQVLSLL